MKNACRLIVLLCMSLGMAGCATYSDFVNSFAPATQKPEAIAHSDSSPQKSTVQSPLCPVPPPPPIREVYMVMPEGGGKAGTVSVTFNDGREAMLHGDYSAMSLAGDENKAYVADQAQMEKTFGKAVAALPQAPTSTTLYFLLGKDELTPESKADAEKIYSDFVKRQAPEVLIVGHTDTVGSEADNEKLSVKRAEKVRQSLIALGMPAENIRIIGRGERELLVATPDKTKEPKNRRVEINVR